MFRLLSLFLLLGMSTCVLADQQTRSITVSGTGFAEIEPDLATLRMSIIAREPTLDAAQNRAANIAGKVLEMADRLGIARDQVYTTGASVRPDYRWNRDKEEQELRGYIAERQIAVKIDDLKKLGAVVEGAVSAGVNQVSPPQLDSSKRKETYRRALRAAAEDAKANAMLLAVTLDARLGPVISINTAATAPGPPVPHAAGMRLNMADAGATETYNAADLSFNAIVTAVFELTD